MHKFLISIIFLLGNVWNLNACSCSGQNTVIDEFNSSSIVIYGKVINIEIISYKESVLYEKHNLITDKFEQENMKLYFESKVLFKVELEIINEFKGDALEKGIIYTTRNGRSCGYLDFEIGKKYIVYGNRNGTLIGFLDISSKELQNLHGKDEYWTNHCKRTKRFDLNEYIQLDEICRELEK